MRRLIFVFVMLFVIGLIFYGQPAYVEWVKGRQSAVVERANDGAGAASPPSYVAQYKAQKQRQSSAPQLTPLQVLQEYSLALIQHEMPYRRDLFTLETQLILPRLNLSAAQMDDTALALEACLPGRVLQNGDFSVIRFALERRECPPYFFEREEQRWRIDLIMSRDHVGYNAQNQWYLIDPHLIRTGVYGFAFGDLYFDDYGYPLNGVR